MTFQLTATKDCGSFKIIYGTSTRALKKKVELIRNGYVVTVAVVLPTAAGVWS